MTSWTVTQPEASTARRIPMYVPEFAADPLAAYRRMRAEFGPLVPVELAPGIPATLVIGYLQARRILNDPLRFPADPRTWPQAIPDTCPVKPMVERRPDALRSVGAAHARYRAANTVAPAAVDQDELRALVEKVADTAIEEFGTGGRAHLLSQYARPGAVRVLSTLLGCPDDIERRVVEAMAAISDDVNATGGNRLLLEDVVDLVTLRRRQPADDITSRLLTQVARLDDQETVHQLVALYRVGIEPLVNLITDAIFRLLLDEPSSGARPTGGSAAREALDTVPHTGPPLAAGCVSCPPDPVEIDGVLLPAYQPVVISMAACYDDPAVTGGTDGRTGGNGAGLAWSAGPHACPARHGPHPSR
ncbi:cytochrome P450 [Streptomyces coerulescens]|uniref:Cytochrome P450 n=1 Tax=Streptomyces coerulescens TaxID=29304 RepID=A0ABW0CDE0_STRCD